MYCLVVFVYELSVSLRKQRPGSLVEKFLNISIRMGRFFFWKRFIQILKLHKEGGSLFHLLLKQGLFHKTDPPLKVKGNHSTPQSEEKINEIKEKKGISLPYQNIRQSLGNSLLL